MYDVQPRVLGPVPCCPLVQSGERRVRADPGLLRLRAVDDSLNAAVAVGTGDRQRM